MEKNKLIWIGPYMTAEKLNNAVEKGYKQVAATLSQNYFLNGLVKNLDKNIDIVSAIRPPAFPNYKELIVKSQKIYQSELISGVNVGFLNIKYLSHLFRQRSLKKASKKLVDRSNDSQITVIVYSLHSPFIKAALEIKKMHPNTEIAVIVPDLPLNMDMSSVLQRFLKKIDWNNIKKLLNNVDKYILFTKNMGEYLGLRSNQWIVIEGLIDIDKILRYKNVEKYSKKTCLYMGTLKKEYKIDKLVDAFVATNLQDAELHIYGEGDYKEKLIETTKKYNNVKYLGYVSSDEAFKIMQKATVLVNPRPTDDDYTKYSCPSKTFEYMASGTPLITTKLEGIPDEYFKHTFTFEDETLEGMTKTLIKILSIDNHNLNKKGKEAREFIIQEKNNIVQTKKIIQFLKLDKQGLINI